MYFKTGDSFEEVYTVEVKPEEEVVFFHPDYDDEEYYSCWLEAGIITLQWIQDTGDNIKGQQWEALEVNCDTISDMLDNKYLDCSVSPSWLEIKAIQAVITLEIITVASDGSMAGMFLSSYEELKAEGIYDDFAFDHGYEYLYDFIDGVSGLIERIATGNDLIDVILEYGLNLT